MDSLSSFLASMIIDEISDKHKIYLLTSMYISSTICQKNEHVKPNGNGNGMVMKPITHMVIDGAGVMTLVS